MLFQYFGFSLRFLLTFGIIIPLIAGGVIACIFIIKKVRARAKQNASDCYTKEEQIKNIVD